MSYTSRHAADVPDDLLVAAREWAADDPDPVTRDELLAIVAAAEGAVLRRDEGATKGETRLPSPTSPTASPGCSSSAPPDCAAPSAPAPTG